jgi:hypothetical protein
LYSEAISRSISLSMSQDKRDHEKQVLMPVIVGFKCEQVHSIIENLWAYSRQQAETPTTALPSSSLSSVFPGHPLYPLFHWGLNWPSISSNQSPGIEPPQSDFTFTVEAMHFRILDASPSIHLFPKSMTHYQNCTGVVFCASLNYLRPADDAPTELSQNFLVMGPGHRRRQVSVRIPSRCTRPRRPRPGESPLEQSLRIFLHLCSTRWFEDVPIILLFTPSDVFMRDLHIYDLRTVFPTYQGGDDYARATQFLTHLFHAQNSSPYRKIYTYFIPQNASAEATTVPVLFNCVKNIVLERGLRYASIIL